MNVRSKPGLWALLAVGLLAAQPAWSTTLQPLSVVDLLAEARVVVLGTVSNVQEETAGTVPATMVTIDVEQTFKGPVEPTLTFRQFGRASTLVEASGLKSLMAAPGSFPEFKTGERMLLFLAPPASWTGLQSTVGLALGAFVLEGGRARNGAENAGLFAGVGVESGLLTPSQQTMMKTLEGPIDEDDFVAFVRDASAGDWIGNNMLYEGSRPASGSGGGKNVPTKN